MTTLHDVGVIQNYGPKRARPKRAMSRILPSVRKVLRRTRSEMWFWVDRDLEQSRAAGLKWYSKGELTFGNPRAGLTVIGWYIALGSRALIVLKGGVK